MTKPKEVLALIPARGNSKSIPRKNICDLGGFPLIAYSIAAGLQSSYVTRTIVSTDNAEIAEIAHGFGAETPFLRPDEFSQDDTLDLPVFVHALQWLAENEDYHPDVVLQLRPTSPFRPHGMLDEAIELLLVHPEADSVRGVVPSTQNPFKMWTIAQDGAMQPLLKVKGIKEPYNTPRQDLQDTYWQTGHIDAIRPEVILKKKSMSGDVIWPLFIDPVYTVDIDTPLDWQNAEKRLTAGDLDIVIPGRKRRPFPTKVKLVIMDFDGVMTDDRVWVDQDGRESVAANRGDGLGLERLKALTDIEVMVMSREKNEVVKKRCQKLGLPVLNSVKDKTAALKKVLDEKSLSPNEVIFVGNDLNDLVCFPLVGYAVVPADAFAEVCAQADMVLGKRGGHGAVREICEILIDRFQAGEE